MATILQFRALAKRPAPITLLNGEQQPSVTSAQLLFFTGVRYERHASEPAAVEKPKRKRQARQARQVEQTGS
jgi:hypothetical protein